ncbi:Hypothetical predicted protein [Lecanosticta acicola]|uniref:Uncharacterized protein n=1 Tax=Lecanosticta acicola TaxID=111012 RepID=A0AAI9ECV5_9PEZI|nr:Hypothetical predicted protein [Lecanosticta acicola]
MESIPAELYPGFTRYMDNSSLYSLRLVSRAVEKKTFATFADRKFEHLHIPLDIDGLRTVLGRLRTSKGEDQGFRVKSITFCFNASGIWSARQPREARMDENIDDLLLKLISKLGNVMRLSVFGWRVSDAAAAAAASSKLFRALVVKPLPKLAEVDLDGGMYCVRELQAFCSAHKGIQDFRMGHCRQHAGACVWTDLFCTLQTDLTLRRFSIYRLYPHQDPTRSWSIYPYLVLSSVRTVRAVRNPNTSRLTYDHYVLRPEAADMIGEVAVKAGMQKLLELHGVASAE